MLMLVLVLEEQIEAVRYAPKVWNDWDNLDYNKKSYLVRLL